MKSITKTIAFSIMIVALLSTAACDMLIASAVEILEASGTIETTEVLLTSEFGGLVSEVSIQEGERASAGQILVRFDDAYSIAQHKQAQAALAQAQANLAQVQVLTELETLMAQQALDDLYENTDMIRAQAQMAVISARDELGRAQNEGLASAEIEVQLAQLEQLLDDLVDDREAMDYVRCKDSTTDAAYAEYIMAKKTYDDEQKEYDDYYAHKKDDDLSRAVQLAKLSEAKRIYDRALANLNWCKEKADPLDVNEKDAELHLTEAQITEMIRELKTYTDPGEGLNKTQARVDQAQAALDQAERELEKLQDGPDPDDVALAEARLKAAGVGLAVAETQVGIAEAALAALEVQIEKMVVTSPVEGTVLVRLVEPGEVVAPGAPLITLAQLDVLTITVYLPEDRYGQIKVGQSAQVSVDSFPDVVFEAMVTRIADEAEYTPRNVQTEEDRRTTVFAIELSVQDPDGRLKPGMPADVIFSMEGAAE